MFLIEEKVKDLKDCTRGVTVTVDYQQLLLFYNHKKLGLISCLIIRLFILINVYFCSSFKFYFY